MKVFLDTNVLLDAIVERQDKTFKENAKLILQLGENGSLDLFMSVLSILTIAYVLKNMSAITKKGIIRNLCSIVTPLPTLPEHIEAMLSSDINDIEDALQVQSALSGNCDIIITRDRSDYKYSGFPYLSPSEFLNRVLI